MSARGRMLSNKISRDLAVNSLSCDGARLLYTWMISHADNLGRMDGEPMSILTTVFPLRRDLTPDIVAGWLEEMHTLYILRIYVVRTLRYVYFPRWSQHQRLSGNMRRTSEFPDPPDEDANPEDPRIYTVRTASVRRTDNVSPEVEVEVEVEGKEFTALSNLGDEWSSGTPDAKTANRESCIGGRDPGNGAPAATPRGTPGEFATHPETPETLVRPLTPAERRSLDRQLAEAQRRIEGTPA